MAPGTRGLRKNLEKTLVTSSMSAAAINRRDLHRWTTFHRACFKGKIKVIRTLLEKGLDMDAKDEDGHTALHCAAESGHADVIEMFIKKRVDAEARTNKGVTALHIAESLHYVGITRILIHRDATKKQ
ncbi:protein VAPYRIN-like [Malus domestica]|uniref:protein VAPYRIN-like n=1 Tax=Malus domestica TaxID=3750 RepID=UPI0039755C1E